MMKTVAISLISKGRSGIDKKFDNLEKLGLIKIKKGKVKNSGHWVSLTEKGEKVAKLLQEIEKIL
jgi:DNA-binding MarR family transcriptional regulator